MTIIDTINQWISSLDTKIFYRYVAAIIAVIMLLMLSLIYYYYSSTTYYTQQIRRVNNQRQAIQELLEKAARVEQQKEEVRDLIEQDPSFKIVGTFDKILESLKLTADLTSTQERPNEQYNEKILSARFTEITMKQLVSLLNELEQNKRIYIKDLEIERSKKNNRRIDARISIATFETRSE